MTRLFLLRQLACALFLAAVSGPALADSSAGDKAAAEALFDDGKKLMQQGQFRAACDKLEQSQRIDPGVGTLLYLGECYEKSGRTASAWATFREATSSARASGQNDRARLGQQRADRLEPTLSRLTISVPPEVAGVSGFEVRRGGAVVPSSLWNVAFPVDPGEQVVEARAPGKKTFSQTVQVGADAARASIAVPVLEDDKENPASATETPAVANAPESSGLAAGTPQSLPVSDTSSSWSGQRTAGIVVVGVGVVGIGVGAVFGIRALNKNSDAENFCKGTHCSANAKPLTDDARHAATISNIAFGAGAVALIAGGVLYFTASSSRASEPENTSDRKLRFIPVASQQGATLLMRGSF
jgi:serine/threonine-protein kinase